MDLNQYLVPGVPVPIERQDGFATLDLDMPAPLITIPPSETSVVKDRKGVAPPKVRRLPLPYHIHQVRLRKQEKINKRN